MVNRIDKEFTKKVTAIEKFLESFGILEDVSWDIEDCKDIAKYYFLNMDFEPLDLLGHSEITMYHDGSFGICKYAVPFFVNDLRSLQEVTTIFYGTPYDLNFRRIKPLDFVRYEINLPEVRVSNCDKLRPYLSILKDCLHKIHVNPNISYS